MTNQYSPIALFVYNRPKHTRETVEALLKNAEAEHSDLFIFSDAAKHEGAQSAVNEVRAFIHQITGFKTISIIEREKNWGLANSVIEGVTRVCNAYGRVIVLEDDLITSPYFLKFINDGLNLYQDDVRVISVAGYSYPMDMVHDGQTFFIRGTNCWGWATWKRGWKLFEKDGAKLLDQLYEHALCYQFDAQGSYGYTKMLKGQVAGRNNSWAVRWHASAFLQNKLTLLPSYSLLKNIGLDGSGTHCSRFENDPFSVDLCMKPVEVYPIPVQLNQDVENSLSRYFNSIKKRRVLNFIKTKLEHFLAYSKFE